MGPAGVDGSIEWSRSEAVSSSSIPNPGLVRSNWFLFLEERGKSERPLSQSFLCTGTGSSCVWDRNSGPMRGWEGHQTFGGGAGEGSEEMTLVWGDEGRYSKNRW